MRSIKQLFTNVIEGIKLKKQQSEKKKQREFDLLDKKAEIFKARDEMLQEKPEPIEINGKSALIFWLSWAFIVYLCYLLYQSLDLLYLILTAFILSMAVESVILFFQKYIHRGLSIILTYLLIFWFFVFWFFLIIPFMAQQSADIFKVALSKTSEIQQIIQNDWLQQLIADNKLIPGYLKEYLSGAVSDPNSLNVIQQKLSENISNIISFGSGYIKNASGFAIDAVAGFFSVIIQIFIVIILAVFFSLEKAEVSNAIATLSGKKEYVATKIDKLYKKLWFWLKWQFMLSIFIWLTVFISLFTLGLVSPIDLPNKTTLALIAWITEFIHLLWPLLWAVPAVLVAVLYYGLTWFVVIAIVYYIIQWFENNVLIPVIMNQALWVSPLLIFLTMLIGASVLWFIWVLLSVPIAVILTLLFEDLFK